MNYDQKEKLKSNVAIQSAAFGVGAAVGAMTKNVASTGTIRMRKGQLANQIGQAMGAAVGNGRGISGAATAGTVVLLTKAAAVTAGVAAAAPIVATATAIGAVGYGVYKLFKSLDE